MSESLDMLFARAQKVGRRMAVGTGVLRVQPDCILTLTIPDITCFVCADQTCWIQR